MRRGITLRCFVTGGEVVGNHGFLGATTSIANSIAGLVDNIGLRSGRAVIPNILHVVVRRPLHGER